MSYLKTGHVFKTKEFKVNKVKHKTGTNENAVMLIIGVVSDSELLTQDKVEAMLNKLGWWKQNISVAPVAGN